MNLDIREIQKSDIQLIMSYWLGASDEDLLKMGAESTNMPTEDDWENMLNSQIETPYEKKPGLATIWLLDHEPVGHCNVNNLKYGESANMHLHMWKPTGRKKGIGTELVKLSMNYFFEKLKLKELICEPYALNPAPNKTVEKIGFTLEKEYVTIPGTINFEQPVKRWVFRKEQLDSI